MHGDERGFRLPIEEPSAAAVAAALPRVVAAGARRRRRRSAFVAACLVLVVGGVVGGMVGLGRDRSGPADVRTSQPVGSTTTSRPTTTAAPGLSIDGLGTIPAGWVVRDGPRRLAFDPSTTEPNVTQIDVGPPAASGIGSVYVSFTVYDDPPPEPTLASLAREALPAAPVPEVLDAGLGQVSTVLVSEGFDSTRVARLPNGRWAQLTYRGLDDQGVIDLVAGLAG